MSRGHRAFYSTGTRRGRGSPVQIIFGRPIRDTIPAHRRNFATEWHCAADTAEAQAGPEDIYDRNVRDMPELFVGNQVAVQDHRTGRWDRYGVVTEVGSYLRWAVLRSPRGRPGSRAEQVAHPAPVRTRGAGPGPRGGESSRGFRWRRPGDYCDGETRSLFPWSCSLCPSSAAAVGTRPPSSVPTE